MDRITKMMEDLDKELEFDLSNLDKVVVRLPMLYNKYLQEWYYTSRAIDKLDIEMSNMYAELFGYYKVHYEVNLSSAEVKSMIENNVDRNVVKQKLSAAKTYAAFLEKSMQLITDTRWSMKALLDYNNFIAGNK